MLKCVIQYVGRPIRPELIWIVDKCKESNVWDGWCVFTVIVDV
jgi:hypothetical protein